MSGRAGDTANVWRLWVGILLFAGTKMWTSGNVASAAIPAPWRLEYKDEQARERVNFFGHFVGVYGVPVLVPIQEDAALRTWYARANATAHVDSVWREEYELITTDAFVDRALREYEPLPPMVNVYQLRSPRQYTRFTGEFYRESIDTFTSSRKTHVAAGERQRAMRWASNHSVGASQLFASGQRIIVRKAVIELACPKASVWVFHNNSCYAGDSYRGARGCPIDDRLTFVVDTNVCNYLKQATAPCASPTQSQNSSGHCVVYRKKPRQVECPPGSEPVIRDGRIKSCRSLVTPRQFVYSRTQKNGKSVDLLAPFTYSLKFPPRKVCPVAPHPLDPDPTRCRVAKVTPAEMRCRDAKAQNLILGNRTCLGITSTATTEGLKVQCPAKSHWVPKLRRCMRMVQGKWRCPKRYTLNPKTGLCNPPTEPEFECPTGLKLGRDGSCTTQGFQDGCSPSVYKLSGLLSAALVRGACEVVREKQYSCPEGFELGSIHAGPDECLQVKKVSPSYVCPEHFYLKDSKSVTQKDAPPPVCVGTVLKPAKLECPQREEVNPYAAAKANNLRQPLDPEFYSDEEDLDPDWSTDNEENLEGGDSGGLGSGFRMRRTVNSVKQRKNHRLIKRSGRTGAKASEDKEQGEDESQKPFPFCYNSIYTKPGYICPLDSMFMHNGLTPFCVYPASQTFAQQSCPNNASNCAARAEPSLEAGGYEEVIVAQPYCPSSGRLVRYGLCETRIPVVPKRVCPSGELTSPGGLWCKGTAERPAIRQCPKGFTLYADTNECKRFETQPAKQFCRAGETLEKRGEQQVCVSRTKRVEHHTATDIVFEAAMWCPWNTTFERKATKKCIGERAVHPIPECHQGGFVMPSEIKNGGLKWLAPFHHQARNLSKTTKLPVCIELNFELGYKGFSKEISKSALLECQDPTMTLVGDTCQQYSDRERVLQCPINTRWNAAKTFCELGEPVFLNPRLYEYSIPRYTATCKSEDNAGFCWDIETSPALDRCPSGYRLDKDTCKKKEEPVVMCPPDMEANRGECVRYILMDPLQKFYNACGYDMHYNCSSCPMGYNYTCHIMEDPKIPLFKPFHGVEYSTGARPAIFTSSKVWSYDIEQ